MATNSNDKDKKIRFGTILEDANNIDPEKTQTHTAYLDDEHRLSVKRDIHGTDWNIEDSIRDKFYAEFNNQQPSNSIRKQIYGFCLDMNEADPSHAMSYTNDNTNYVPLTIKQREKCDYGSWKEFIADFVGCRPCALYEDGTVYRYLDPDDYTKDLDGNKIGIDASNAFDEKGRPYNIMIEFKHNWYRMYTKNNKFYFQVANYKVNEDFIDDAFLYNGKSMNYLYVNAFSPEFHMVNSVEKIKSVYAKDHYQNSYQYHSKFYAVAGGENNNNVNHKSSLIMQRKNIMENYKNSSTFGYSQCLYLILLTIMLFKNSNYSYTLYDSLPENAINYIPSIPYDIFKEQRGNELYNKGLFYSDINIISRDGNNYSLPRIHVFGMDSLFQTYYNLDGLFLNDLSLYYTTAPYTCRYTTEISSLYNAFKTEMHDYAADINNSRFPLFKQINGRIVVVEMKNSNNVGDRFKILNPLLIDNHKFYKQNSEDKDLKLFVLQSIYNNSDGNIIYNEHNIRLYVEDYTINSGNYSKKTNFCQFR